MAETKKAPLRTCIVCRKSDVKSGFVRLVKTNEGRVDVDETGKANGRGAYVCRNKSCIDGLISTKILKRALRLSDLSLDIEELRLRLENITTQKG